MARPRARRITNPTRRADLARLALGLVLAVAGAVAHLGLPLDLGNRSMKATGTADALVAQRRAEEFGEEQVLVGLLEPRGRAVSSAPDDPEVAAWLERLPRVEGVDSVRVLPASDDASLLVALTLGVDHAALEEVVARVRRSAPPTHALSLTGQPAGEVAIARALSSEQSRIVPAIVAVLVALLLAVYRRPSLAFAALLPGAGAVGTIGLLERALDLSIDPVSSLLAPVLLTVGVAAAVHLVERHLDLVGTGRASGRTEATAARRLRRPLTLTAATTAAGFLALVPNSIPAVRTLGVTAAVGVGVALAYTLLVVPSWLRLTARVDHHERAARRPARRGASLAARALALNARGITVGALLLFGALALEGAAVGVDTNPERVLPADHRFRVETARVSDALGASETFEVLVPARADGTAPPLGAALALVADLGRHELVAGLAGPIRRGASGSLLVSALLRPSGTRERERLFAHAEERAAAHGLEGARVTGPAVLVSRDSQELVRDQRRSLALVLVVVAAALLLAFRDWRLAALGLVPNVAPIAALYGGLALTGHPLSASTAMIGTVFLGLVVDDTIHFLHAYHRARRAGAHPRTAVTEAFVRSARAIVVTTFVLAAGFGAAALGSLATTVEFAVIASGTVVVALVADLVVLPALLLLSDRDRQGRGDASVEVVEPCPNPST